MQCKHLGALELLQLSALAHRGAALHARCWAPPNPSPLGSGDAGGEETLRLGASLPPPTHAAPRFPPLPFPFLQNARSPGSPSHPPALRILSWRRRHHPRPVSRAPRTWRHGAAGGNPGSGSSPPCWRCCWRGAPGAQRRARGGPWREAPARGSKIWGSACCCGETPLRSTTAMGTPRGRCGSEGALPCSLNPSGCMDR